MTSNSDNTESNLKRVYEICSMFTFYTPYLLVFGPRRVMSILHGLVVSAASTLYDQTLESKVTVAIGVVGTILVLLVKCQ